MRLESVEKRKMEMFSLLFSRIENSITLFNLQSKVQNSILQKSLTNII